jgi:hypothetical protein
MHGKAFGEKHSLRGFADHGMGQFLNCINLVITYASTIKLHCALGPHHHELSFIDQLPQISST